VTDLAREASIRRRWQPILLLAPFQFIFGLIYSWGAISPAIHAQSGWSQNMLNLAFSLTPLALLPSVIAAGHLLQRMAPKTLLAIALACFTLGGAAGLAANGAMMFMLGYSVLALGVGAGLSTAACIALVSRLYPQAKGTLGGGLLALYGVSSILSAPLFAALDEAWGWRRALAVVWVTYAAVGWFAWILLPAAPASGTRHTARVPIMHVLRHRSLRWAMFIVLAAAPLGSASFAAIGHLTRAIGYGPGFGLLAVSMMALGNGAGRLGFGLLADWRSAAFSRNVVLGVNSLAGALLLLALHGAVVWAFTIYPLLAGLAFGGMAGKLPALAAHVVEEGHAESAFGLLFGTFALASFLGPLANAAFGVQEAATTLAMCAISALGMAIWLTFSRPEANRTRF